MNKKGFSLVELLVTITIIGILAAMLAPAITSSISDSKKGMDETNLTNLTTTIQMGMQHNSIYKDARKIADNTLTGKIVVKYYVNQDNIVLIDSCEVADRFGGTYTDADRGDLAKLKTLLSDYVNGKIEPIELKSNYYRDCDYKFTITFPDVEFKVNVEMEVVE